MADYSKKRKSDADAPRTGVSYVRKLLAESKTIWRDISLRKKVILYTGTIMYIFTLLFGILIYSRANSSLEQITFESTQQQMKNLKSEIIATLDNYSARTLTLLLDSNFHEMLEQNPVSLSDRLDFNQNVSRYLSALCSSTPISSTWTLFTKNDDPIIRDNRIRPISEVYGTKWFEKLASQKRNMISWYLEPGSDLEEGRLLCSLGVENMKNGDINAYFQMSIDFSSIISPLKTAREEMRGAFLLYSQNGDFLWGSEEDSLKFADYVLPYGSADEFQTVSVSGSLGEHTVITLDGGKYGFTVYYIQDLISPMNSYMNFGNYFLIILAVIISLSLYVLLLSANVVDGRIINFTEEIKALDETTLDFTPDLTSKDEVGALSRAFFELIKRIKSSNEKLREVEDERFELEVAALQAQINPHFLFNTIAVIDFLAQDIEADDISQALESLANFYRYSLRDGKRMITVRDELAILDYYLTICTIRYQNQLDVRKDIDPGVLDFVIPKLILQPFCENAVFHAYSPDSPTSPQLSITAKVEEDHLLFIISDNGSGMSSDKLENATKNGFAIQNVQKRIQMLYGKEYGVSISSIPGEGTQVFIRLGFTADF